MKKCLLAIRIISICLVLVIAFGINSVLAYADDDNSPSNEELYYLDHNIQYGAYGKDVARLQVVLNRIVQECNLVVDGSFGPKTKEALETFQTNYCIEVTGYLDDATRELLNSEFQRVTHIKKVMVKQVSSYLNVRDFPNVDARKIGEVHSGDVFEVLDFQNGWYKINYQDQMGWISSDYAVSSFVIVSKSEQAVHFYLNNIEFIYSPVVTGCVNNACDTPNGVYTLHSKEEDATLMNDSFVDYWMNFIPGPGIGFHDADRWRSSYGGDIYLDHGSHGCVNMPFMYAEVMYNNIKVGTTIVVTD